MREQYRWVSPSGFVFSRFSGEGHVYLWFPETDAGDSGATLIDVGELLQGLWEMNL